MTTAIETGHSSQGFIVQRLLYPTADINSEVDLFFKTEGEAFHDTDTGVYFVGAGTEISFGTYFNALHLSRYEVEPGTALEVAVSGHGEAVLQVFVARLTRSSDLLATKRVNLNDGGRDTLVVHVPEVSGVVYVSLRARTDVEISGIDYKLLRAPRRNVTIAGTITTFRRDEAVQSTVRRLKDYFAENRDIEDKFQLVVVDNGGETNRVDFERSRLIKNPNYGGAGGFSRGLIEVVDQQLATHCLFMDDDASFFPEVIRRTLAVLSYSDNPALSIAGALITNTERWRLWENGAVFDRGCRPIDSGRDLREFEDVLHVALTPQTALPNKYGGWWYFCFPVSEVKVWPFPFFVRGDDVSFSLANDFDIKTVLGVVSHQDDFFAKQTPMTVYLDMRSHFVHHLTIPRLRGSLWQDIKLFTSFFYRFNASYHYESAKSVILAIEDISKGRQYWLENLDMSEKRRQISAFTDQEKLRSNIAFDQDRIFFARKHLRLNRLMRFLQDISLNGHIVPRWMFFTRGKAFPLSNRGNLGSAFLRPFVLRTDFESGQGYVVRRDVKRFFGNLWSFGQAVYRYARAEKRIKAEYETLYPLMASKDFWVQHLDLPASDTPAEKPTRVA